MKFTKRLLKTSLVQKLISVLAASYLGFTRLTSSCKYGNQTAPEKFWKEEKSFILAFWHSQIMLTSGFWNSKHKIHILTSTHSDGNIIAMTSQYFRWVKIIPVSSKGDLTLRKMFKLLRSNKYVGITPDGPRGPKEKSSEGVIKIAQRTGVPIIPVGSWTTNHIIAKSWDSLHIPLPFSRIYYSWGDPIVVPRDIGKEEIGYYQELLDEKISACVQDAKNKLSRGTVVGKRECSVPK